MEEKEIIEIIEIIKESFTMNSVCKKVYGYCNKGSLTKVKSIIEKYNINTKHFSRGKTQQKYEIIKKKCPICEVEFETKQGSKKEKTTCSKSCGIKYFQHGINNKNFNLEKYEVKKEKISESVKKIKSTSFTEEEILEIKDLYNQVKSTRKVSQKLGISRDYVTKYVDIYIPVKLTEEELKINSYQSVYNWRKKAKETLVGYKGGKCINCGYSKCIEGLDFHHLNPKEKDFEISGKSYSLDRLKKEVDKCVLLCSNCHREFHAGYLTLNLE